MKLFALYLPQFHETYENNEWWGKGFTEWVNVKKAKPLFKGHVQPRHPLNQNYYNLLDKKTVEWQTSIMHEYGISGMVYYHYYFNGRLILEKPTENLLEWTDINQPFFFCWANHSWNRSWLGTKELLVEQTYGNEENWRKHFDYLLPFFKDARYEKIDGRPVFMLYDISCPVKDEMFEKFDLWAKNAGFQGIHIIEEHFNMSTFEKQNTSASETNTYKHYYVTEPLVGKNLFLKSRFKIFNYFDRFIEILNQKGIINHLKKYDANKIYLELMKKQKPSKKLIPGIFFEWDNTPRHGHRGYIITPVKKAGFFDYMDTIKDSDYAIINAWNEWCEGMILEPSVEDGYKYLEWIKEWNENNR